jgi:hypothetical protein
MDFGFFSQLWSQIGFQIDMFRISVPSIILQPVSLLEKFSSMTTPNTLVNRINEEKSEVSRSLKLMFWIIYNLRKIPKKTYHCTKPYNPTLYEIFECSWKNEDDTENHYIAEQVK